MLTWSCLLALAMLTACDASQWPLANPSRPVSRHPGMAPPGDKSANAAKTAPRNRTAAAATASDSGITPAATLDTASLPTTSGSGEFGLVGLNTEQTKVMLGPPTEEVERAPAKIWRYRTPQCSLDVALYPDVQTHDFRVLNYEVNGNDGTEQGRRQCIAGLRSGLRTR